MGKGTRGHCAQSWACVSTLARDCVYMHCVCTTHSLAYPWALAAARIGFLLHRHAFPHKDVITCPIRGLVTFVVRCPMS